MQNLTVGQKVTINETMTPGEVVKVDFINVVVLDENGNQHVLRAHDVSPRSFLTEGQ